MSKRPYYFNTKSIEKNKKLVYTINSGEIMNKHILKQIIKFIFLFLLLITATQQVYSYGKKSYQNYVNTHEHDLEWVEKNIVLEDNYKIGNQVKVVHMPDDLTVSKENYTEIMNKKIKTLLVKPYSIDNPLLIYNPYLEDENSLYIYFHTGEKYQAQYFVSTKSIVMQDIEELKYQSFLDENGNNLITNRHYYKINSLIPGKRNNIIIRILDKDGTVIEADNFILNVPNKKS